MRAGASQTGVGRLTVAELQDGGTGRHDENHAFNGKRKKSVGRKSLQDADGRRPARGTVDHVGWPVCYTTAVIL